MARPKWTEWENRKDNLNVLSAWARAGLTDEQIAKHIGISRSTLSEWKKKYPNIAEALNTGEEFSNRLVEHSLYKMTQGFHVTVKKAIKVKKIEYDPSGKKISEKEEIELAEETEYIKPDIKAIIFYAKNKMPEIWQERVTAEPEENGSGIIVLTPAKATELKEMIKDEEEKENG